MYLVTAGTSDGACLKTKVLTQEAGVTETAITTISLSCTVTVSIAQRGRVQTALGYRLFLCM